MTRNFQHWILLGCGLVGIGCIILLGCIGIYLMPRREIPVMLSDLLVEPSMVPGEWELADTGEWEPIPKRAVVEDYRAWEGVIRVLRRPEPQCKEFDHVSSPPLGCDTISHELLRYQNEWQARLAFASGSLPARSEWQVPREWTFQNFQADQFRFGCEEVAYNYYKATICTAMARYGSVISIVTIRMFTDRMTVHDVERILRAIDEHIVNQLTGRLQEN